MKSEAMILYGINLILWNATIEYDVSLVWCHSGEKKFSDLLFTINFIVEVSVNISMEFVKVN
ncbi:hypothetical protein BLOT_006378 [Blomia tropicalis]|nr:hypothetical protein BLOT_006378 [Blomia tropicalis]